MKNTSIILLANGKGSRFRSKFKETPKPLIIYKKEPLILWSLRALKTIITNSWENLTVVSKYDSVRNYVNKELNLKVFNPGSTNSPAETIFESKPIWQDSKILYTLDCDVYFEGENINNISPFTLYTVNSSSKNFSYVKTDQNGLVNEIKEKNVISNNAVVGFYSFDAEKLKYFFKTAKYKELANQREVFLSDVIRDQIMQGIKYSISEVKSYKSMGTPYDLKE